MGIDRRTATALGTLAAAVVLALLSWVVSTGDSSGDVGGGSNAGHHSITSPAASPAQSGPASGLPLVSAADLPLQGRATLALIDDGGPFPYPDRDGVVFGNYEGLLPQHQRGYYHEYTVPTPGESDRGARRIITGSSDEFFWTADHYATFAQIDRS